MGTSTKRTVLRQQVGLVLAGLMSLTGCGVEPRQEQPEQEQPEQAQPEQAQPEEEDGSVSQAGCSSACGTTMTTLDGVPAYSNASGTGSCGENGTYWQYGLRWQCVEYARRYWSQAWGKSFNSVTYACNICDLAGLTKRYPYDGYQPKRGDLIVQPCTSSSVTGHVAVVASVTGTYNNWTINAVEQNKSCTGRSNYHFSTARCFVVR
jgi:hypothetical protein